MSEKEREIKFLDLNIEALKRMADDCYSFVLIQRDMVLGSLLKNMKNKYIDENEVSKYFTRINNISHKFHEKCKCGVIK